MDIRWKETFNLHAQTEDFKNRVKEANEIISKALKRYNPYVAFSGGKDSTVMVHLVLRQKPDIMILHWDYGRYYIPRVYHEEIKRIIKKMGRDLRIETSPLYNSLKRKAINVLGREMFGKLIPKLMDEGYNAVFVGLRAEESPKRKRRIKADKSLSPIKEFFPLKNWRWLDVWAYLVSNNVPYLSFYDKYCPVLGYDKARFTTLFDPEFDRLGASNIDGVLSWRFRNIAGQAE